MSVPSFRFYKLALAGLGLLWVDAVFGAAGNGTAENGAALFFGREPLTGKIREHETNLPSEVLICSHCHTGAQGKRLDRAMLLSPQQRRGGPPSNYDEAKFCRLLRTGVDPAYILVARQMPVYTATDDQCADLWRFLTTDAKR